MFIEKQIITFGETDKNVYCQADNYFLWYWQICVVLKTDNIFGAFLRTTTRRTGLRTPRGCPALSASLGRTTRWGRWTSSAEGRSPWSPWHSYSPSRFDFRPKILSGLLGTNLYPCSKSFLHRNVTPPPSTCLTRSTRLLIQCTERWEYLLWRHSSVTQNVTLKRWATMTLCWASQSFNEEVDNQNIKSQAVADMIHELADGAQFITTTFRFLIGIFFFFFLTPTMRCKLHPQPRWQTPFLWLLSGRSCLNMPANSMVSSSETRWLFQNYSLLSFFWITLTHLQVSHVDCVTKEEAFDFVDDDATQSWEFGLTSQFILSSWEILFGQIM